MFMYAKHMELLFHIFNIFDELDDLAHTFIIDGVHFIAICTRSHTALATKNLFLRIQHPFYQERKDMSHVQYRHYLSGHLTTTQL
jgi:hypothetical protein